MDIENLGYKITENGEVINSKGIILKGWNNQGYRMITIRDQNGKQKKISIHRLVAEKYIPNPNKFPCVNHKDKNRANNRVENLEWCNHQYNNEYSCAKQYLIENVKTKERFEVFNLNKWCKSKGLYSGALIGTLTSHNRFQHKGYRVLKVIEQTFFVSNPYT